MVTIKFADEKVCDSIFQNITSLGKKSDELSLWMLLSSIAGMNLVYLMVSDRFATLFGFVDLLGFIVMGVVYIRCILKRNAVNRQLSGLDEIERQIARMRVIYAITEQADRPPEDISLGDDPGTLYKVLIVKRSPDKTELFLIMPELIVDTESGDSVVDFTKISDLRDSIIGKEDRHARKEKNWKSQ